MKFLSKLLIVTFISLSLSSVSADVQENTNSISPDGIFKVKVFEDSGAGFFVGPHTLVTAYHVVKGLMKLEEDISRHLFIVHPITKKRILVHVRQALDFGNDRVVLHISGYESPVHYELFEGSPESLSSSEVYILNLKKKGFPKLEGVLSPQYSSEASILKTLSLFTLRTEALAGLSGSPVFSKDGKVIGVFSGEWVSDIWFNKPHFSEIHSLKNILSKPSLNCKTGKCIQDAIYEGNSKEAQYERGMNILNKNKGYELDINTRKEAVYWLTQAAEQGFAPAMYHLSQIYLKDQNEVLYKEWLTKAAEYNHGFAQLGLSRFLLVYKEDPREGIKWAQKATEHGLFLPLGVLDYLVEEKVINEKEYRYYVEDFAERGHPEAQLEQVQYLFEEAQSNVDREKALNLLKKLEKVSYPPALYGLSLIYEQGLYGEKQDMEKARSLEKKAIELGYVPEDRQAVLKLIEQDYFLNLDVLEDFIEENIISEQEYRQYVEDFSERGYPEAQKRQMYYFISENNSDENEIKSTMGLIMSVFESKGYPKALYGLSVFYQTGMFVKQDIKKAKILKKKAVELGYVGDGVMSKVTIRIQSAVGKVSQATVNACQKAFEKIKN